MDNNEFDFTNDDMVDISSRSKSFAKTAKEFTEITEKYGNGVFKNLGTIIKCIAFILCFLTIIISIVGAFFLFSFDKFFIVLSLGIVVFGIVAGLIILFLIYGMGQIICQNNEIISRLKKLNKK